MPVMGPLNQPKPAPHFDDDMSQKDLHTLRKHRGCLRRDARSPLMTILLDTGRNERKRALDNPDAESSAAKKRPLMATLHSVFVADEAVVKRHGHWWDPVPRDSGYSGRWHLRGVTQFSGRWGGCGHSGLDSGLAWQDSGQGTLAGTGAKLRPIGKGRELAARKEFNAFRPVARATIK